MDSVPEEIAEIEQLVEEQIIEKQVIDAELEFQFLEDTFNLFLKDEIQRLKLTNITKIKGWLAYNKHTVLKLQAGTMINLFLLGENKNILTDPETWKMIRHCLSSADKRKMQTSSSLVPVNKALEFKLDFYRENHKGKIVTYKDKEAVIELLPKTRVKLYESATVTVTLIDTVTKLSSSVTMPYDQYPQAKYAANVDLARKVKLLEMEKEA